METPYLSPHVLSFIIDRVHVYLCAYDHDLGTMAALILCSRDAIIHFLMNHDISKYEATFRLLMRFITDKIDLARDSENVNYKYSDITEDLTTRRAEGLTLRCFTLNLLALRDVSVTYEIRSGLEAGAVFGKRAPSQNVLAGVCQWAPQYIQYCQLKLTGADEEQDINTLVGLCRRGGPLLRIRIPGCVTSLYYKLYMYAKHLVIPNIDFDCLAVLNKSKCLQSVITDSMTDLQYFNCGEVLTICCGYNNVKNYMSPRGWSVANLLRGTATISMLMNAARVLLRDNADFAKNRGTPVATTVHIQYRDLTGVCFSFEDIYEDIAALKSEHSNITDVKICVRRMTMLGREVGNFADACRLLNSQLKDLNVTLEVRFEYTNAVADKTIPQYDNLIIRRTAVARFVN